MHTVKLLKRAELELIDGCEWYEKEQKGLSLKFRSTVRSSLNSIAKNPQLFSQKYNTDLRFAPINKFPYIIVYWYDETLEMVFVVSIFHTKRNPESFESK